MLGDEDEWKMSTETDQAMHSEDGLWTLYPMNFGV